MSEFLRVGDRVRVLDMEELEAKGVEIEASVVFNYVKASYDHSNTVLSLADLGKIGFIARAGYNETMQISLDNGESTLYLPYWALKKVDNHCHEVNIPIGEHSFKPDGFIQFTPASAKLPAIKYAKEAVEELKEISFEEDERPLTRYKKYNQLNTNLYTLLKNLTNEDVAYEYSGLLWDLFEDFYRIDSKKMYNKGCKDGAKKALQMLVDEFTDKLDSEE